MKTLFASAALLFTTLASLTTPARAFAGGDIPTAPADMAAATTKAAAASAGAFKYAAYMSSTKPNHVWLILLNPAEAPVKMQILDADGQVQYAKKYATDSAMQSLNCAGLAPGHYTLRLSQGATTALETFTIVGR